MLHYKELLNEVWKDFIIYRFEYLYSGGATI